MTRNNRVYDLGGRRVIVTGTGPLGCVPAELAMRGGTNGECSDELQRAAALYNPQLLHMLQALNNKIGKDVFIAANTGQMHTNFITSPTAYVSGDGSFWKPYDEIQHTIKSKSM
ncbi:hypothetical protein Lal_00017443 [Lupinus albus]|nr:hypothetical protein Lal_00017443 [Lupinus albus]